MKHNETWRIFEGLPFTLKLKKNQQFVVELLNLEENITEAEKNKFHEVNILVELVKTDLKNKEKFDLNASAIVLV